MDKGMPIKSDSNPSFSLVLALFSDFDFDCRQGPRLRPKTLAKTGQNENSLEKKGGVLLTRGRCQIQSTLSQRYMVPNCLKWINIEFFVNSKPVLGSLPLDFVHEGNKWQKSSILQQNKTLICKMRGRDPRICLFFTLNTSFLPFRQLGTIYL